MEMSGIARYMIRIAVLLSALYALEYTAAAQIARPGFDESFMYLANDVVHDRCCNADDYLQYSPGVLMLGLKIGGYDGRSSWGRMIVSDAFSAAVMTASVCALKYSVSRERPDGSSYDSFPSGHAAKSFMLAAMLHEEYGWRSPWFSLGGYAAAAATGVMRVANDRHWASDVITGAVIGIASVKLGYFLADLIFRDRGLDDDYSCPVPGFDYGRKYYDASLYCGYRFLLGSGASGCSGGKVCAGGSSAGIGLSIPVSDASVRHGTAGVAFRAGANSWLASGRTSFNTYDFLVGGYWRKPFARLLEVDTRLLAGYSVADFRYRAASGGFSASAECGLAVASGGNFKIKAFAACETSCFTAQKPFIYSVVLGASAAFFW